METYDQILTKYGAVLVSYIIQALPMFGPDKATYLARYHNNASRVARDYIRN